MAPQVQRPRGRSKPGMSEEQQGTRVAGMEGRKGRGIHMGEQNNHRPFPDSNQYRK